jgi:hypothetical protein
MTKRPRSRIDRRKWKRPLPPLFKAAIDAFNQWSQDHLKATQAREVIATPLYHYTDKVGLQGIITNQEVWFTDHWHVNDPTEIKFGIEIASKILREIGDDNPRIRLFCEAVLDLFSHKNLSNTFGFFIGSFTRERDDLGQWRAYARDGRGYALGLAPSLFGIEDMPDAQPHEKTFVAPVLYGEDGARRRHMPAIAKAAQLVLEAVEHGADLMQDINVGLPFFDKMGKALMASELILNCLTVKDEGYKSENEVRLFTLGQVKDLAPHLCERTRNGEKVSYIKSRLKVQTPGGIAEIIVGPAAPPDAEDFARSLLAPFHNDPGKIIRRSRIPYRAF